MKRFGLICLAMLFLSGCGGNGDVSVSTPRDGGQHFVVDDVLRAEHGRIVWLDAGHGGTDGGTQGTINGVTYLEKDITLNIVLMVYEMFRLSDSGVKAFLLRDGDEYVARGDRPLIWNETADLVVSVHLDFFDGEQAQNVSGVQVFYYDAGLGNSGRLNLSRARFAQIMQDRMVAETGARDRRIRGDVEYTVVARSTMPAVIIETGFMSNDAELALLITEEYQLRIARAIYLGIVEAFERG